MQVILQEDVAKLGNAGEVVTVREGFARNFLLPQKKAVVADPKNLKMLEHQKRVIAAQQAALKAEAQAFAAKLAKAAVTLSREAGAIADEVEGAEGAKVVAQDSEERIFGSVTNRDISEALREAGFTVDRRDIQIHEPIRKLGNYEVAIKLQAGVVATVNVAVVKK